jgi:hypothetical protein
VIRSALSLAAGVVAAAGLLAAPLGKTQPIQFISLKGHTNVKLSENLHSDRFPDNNLKSLPTGKQKLGDVEFEIGDGVLQLGSAGSPDVATKPSKIEGIKVGRTLKKLHFLQACGYSTEPDTVIGKYVIHYDDKTTAEAEIVYGKDVVDWWAYPDRAAPTKGKVAWEGENEAAKGFDAKIKLYLMTWENPKPDKRVEKIDFVATNPEQPAAPFCVAITAEDK